MSGRTLLGGPALGDRAKVCPSICMEPPRDLGHVQADALRLKKQGGMVWMALAMMVQTRLGRGGEVRAQRDLPLIRRLLERVRCGAVRRPLWVCTEGLVSYIRALRETFASPCTRGKAGGPSCVPGATSAWPKWSSATSGGGSSRRSAVVARAHRHASQHSDAAHKGTA